MQGALGLLDTCNEGSGNPSDPEFLQYIAALFPDVAPYKRAELRPYSPRPELFSQNAMAQRPGMAYLLNMQLNLIAPSTEDEDSQMAEVNAYFDQMLSYCQRTSQFYDKMLAWRNDEIDLPILGFDTETDGLDKRILYDKYGQLIRGVKIAGICLAVNGNTGYYLPTNHTGEDGIINWCRRAEIHLLNRIFEESVPLMHNAQYDVFVSQIAGCKTIRPYPRFVDTQIGIYHYDVNEKKNGLKNMAEVHLGRPMMKIEELFGATKKDDVITFDRICASDATTYAALDAANTYQLFMFLLDSPINPYVQQLVVSKIDSELCTALIDLYKPGMPVDYDYNLCALHDCVMRADMLKQHIWRELGQEFSLESPKQLSHMIFDVMQVQPLPNMVRGKSGSYPTGEEELEALADKNPHISGLVAIVDWRKIISAAKKTHAKFMANSFLDYRDPTTRVGVDFNASNVPTGRLSSGSGSGRSGVYTKFSKGTMNISSQRYEKNDWVWGGNSQGIGAPPTMNVKLKRIKTHLALDLDNPYPEEVRMVAATKVVDAS